MLSRLLILGATGDLVERLLLPALAHLGEAGLLPDDLRIVGAARPDWDDERFRAHAAEHLELHAAAVAASVRDDLITRLHYVRADVTDPVSVAAVIRAAEDLAESGTARPLALYLALPAQLVPATLRACKAAVLPPGSRIAVEKPFGTNHASAVELNERLAAATDDPGDDPSVEAFRVDHALGMETVWNLLALRADDPLLRAVWSSAHIERMEILWEETLALEGRASYFDGAGTLKDVMQNHMMQVLSIATMEEPAARDELRDRKVEILRAIPTYLPAEAAVRSRRGRYTAGRLADDDQGGGRDVPSYADEEGVDPGRATETFAEVTLEIDTPRWRGTTFVLRAGKALAQTRKGVLVWFRPVPGQGFLHDRVEDGARLWIGVDGPNDIRWETAGMTSLSPDDAAAVTLRSPPLATRLPPYGHVLLDILRGGTWLSVRGDEAEEAWRILDPVLDAWRQDLVPLEDYAAGSSGVS